MKPKKQELKGKQLLNKLFLKFSSHVNKHHEVTDGQVILWNDVFEMMVRCNNAWRKFVNNNRRNPKRNVDFGVYAFQELANGYLQSLKKQYWKSYMLKFMDDRYGMDVNYDELEQYYEEDMNPEEAAVQIVRDIKTKNTIDNHAYC